MDDLIAVMTNKELKALAVKHTGNTKITELVNGILEARLAEAIEAEALKAFEAKVDEILVSLPHPTSVTNILMRWAKVDIEDTSKEKEEVTIVDTQAVLDKDGKITTPAVTHTEMRHPTIEAFKYVSSVNHACGTRGSGTGTPQAKKRGITVSRRESPTSANLVLVGHFPSGAKACEYLKLDTAGDSAIRVIRKENYFIEDYDGTDYTLA